MASTENPNSAVQDRLLGCMLAADRAAAARLVESWAADRSYAHAVHELLDPVLARFGDMWAGGKDVNLAQGYVSAKIAEDLLLKVAGEQPAPPDGVLKGPVILGNIEDDYHALGRKLVATFMRAAGWEVVDLGNDVLAETFVDKAEETGAKLIGASAMMYVNAVNITKLREEIDRRGLTGRVQLAVGGAVFIQRPDLVDEVGGDGTAPNALAAVKLMDDLWTRAEGVG